VRRHPASEWADAAAWGAAVGGAAVWTLALAARVGWLRALLDLYPPPAWEQVTWIVIPALLLLPVVLQGAAVAALAPAGPLPPGRTILGALAGTGSALVALGLVLGAVIRHAPRLAGSAAARDVPAVLALAWAAVCIAAACRAAGRAWGGGPLRRLAVPAGAAAALAAWLFARGWAVEASRLLDQLDTAVFFTAVAGGGAAGAAWTACRPGRAGRTDGPRR
jgi:hypothetical protein